MVLWLLLYGWCSIRRTHSCDFRSLPHGQIFHVFADTKLEKRGGKEKRGEKVEIWGEAQVKSKSTGMLAKKWTIP
jgi:hypothetical protein